MASSPALSLSAATPPPGLGFRRIALLDVVVPFLAVLFLLHSGVAPLTAYAAAGLFPAASVVVAWVQHRHADPIGIGVLAGLASALSVAVLTGDPRFGLVRTAPAFATFGLACFVSLTTRRPLMFFVARSFVARGDAARIAIWNARVTEPGFRHVMRRLTVVWGAGTLAHAGLGVAVAFLLPGSVALILEPTMGVAILTALLAWTRAVQRRGSSPAL